MSVTRVKKQLSVTAMVLDPVVQRIRHEFRPAMREANVAKIADHFDLAKCDPLLVRMLDDGSIGVGHGGHRLEAARRLGIPTLPCEVVQGLNGEGDAYWVDLCLSSHDERQWEPLNRFLVRLEVGAEPERSIELILSGFGTRTSTTAETGYVCVDKLRKLYALDLLMPTILAIETAWAGNVVGHSGLMVEAIGTFIWAYSDDPNFDRDVLTEKLTRRSPVDLVRDARTRNAALRAGVLRLLCQNLRDIYNKGRRATLPEFKMPRRLAAK